MAFKAVGFVSSAATEPIFTGGLLYLLTRGPTNIRERILQPFQSNLLSMNGVARLAAFITVLKVLTAAGVLKRINAALNAFALNYWSFRRAGPPFKFGESREELVVITGGSSGFGYEMVKGFAKVARVVALDVSPFPPELESLPGVSFYKCDISDTPTVQAVCEEIRQAHGNPSVLINNAGIGSGRTILESRNEDTEKLLKVNLISHFVLIREFLPGMLEMKKGHIVSMASLASFIAGPGMVDYCVSKVGALYLNDALRAECFSRYEGGEAICTTSVHPSWHRTGIIKGAEAAIEKRGWRIDPPTNVSNAVIEQVLKAKSGRLVVPKSIEKFTGTRSWPLWLQDVFFGLPWRKRKGDQIGALLPQKDLK